MVVNELAEVVPDTVLVSDVEHSGSCITLPMVKKHDRMNPALLAKVSKPCRKANRTYEFIKDAKKQKKLYSKITNDIIHLVKRLHVQTHCYGTVMFSSIDSIALGHTKSHFTPNLTGSEKACKVLEDCSQELGNLMAQQWLLSQTEHSLQVDCW
ncbi:hypothetical protein BDM02DRAFT_2494969 [Thelephora ganbajun]|uniref:Uncharacterized protein n=1 Tax=Thelephora ganbajun TaxID=370292 RepID=A0ACB6YYJ3_THEGA|nr:hypothetical protein BDM02DRAFT_2494969 [Thelephora ganbajun]